MSFINAVFAELQKDLNSHLEAVRVQVLSQFHQRDLGSHWLDTPVSPPAPTPAFDDKLQRNIEQFQETVIEETQRLASNLDRLRDDMMTYVKSMESRMEALEKNQSPLKSGGLEGILMKTIHSSPALSAKSENVVISNIQHQLVLDDDIEPDEEALEGEIAEQAGELVEEETEEEEEVVEEVVEEVIEEVVEEAEEEEAEEEEEQVEELELEEFPWKGRTYYKSQHNMIYRANEDGEIEDEPFAEFDPKTNRLTRIS